MRWLWTFIVSSNLQLTVRSYFFWDNKNVANGQSPSLWQKIIVCKCGRPSKLFVQPLDLSWSLGVDFNNILGTNFCTSVVSTAFFYVHVTREKLPKQCLYKKFWSKTLMKLTNMAYEDIFIQKLYLLFLNINKHKNDQIFSALQKF